MTSLSKDFAKQFANHPEIRSDILSQVTSITTELLKEHSSPEDFENLNSYLTQGNYFKCPCSIGYHLSMDGGLAIHCLNVYNIFKDLIEYNKANISEADIVHASFLHDLCKMENYRYNPEKDSWWYSNLRGHAELSLAILETINYPISKKAKNLIKYHMGIFRVPEFNKDTSEYTTPEYTKALKDPDIFLFHAADMMACHYLEK